MLGVPQRGNDTDRQRKNDDHRADAGDNLKESLKPQHIRPACQRCHQHSTDIVVEPIIFLQCRPGSGKKDRKRPKQAEGQKPVEESAHLITAEIPELIKGTVFFMIVSCTQQSCADKQKTRQRNQNHRNTIVPVAREELEDFLSCREPGPHDPCYEGACDCKYPFL